ncbi:hypothetical protein [Enterococcus ureasiticus]|nr:hypothetical protein [Enterococcus ureasiticus]
MIIATLISSFLGTGTIAKASDLVLDEVTGYSYTGVSPHLSYAITHDPFYIMKVDGKKVFCVESGILADTGGGYIPEAYVNAKKDILSKITYYGFTMTSQSNYNYTVIQIMIWEELGDQYISSTIPNYEQ